MLKNTLAAAAVVAVAALGVLSPAQARSPLPRDGVVQVNASVTKVDYRQDRHRAERPRRHRDARPHHRRLHRGQIVRRLAWRGYYGFSKVRDRGPVYAVGAYSPRGHRVRLRVNAYTGEVLHRRPVGHHRPDRRSSGRGGGFRFSR